MRGSAAAKINLALVVGPVRGDGKHEVATVLQRVDLVDRISIEPARELSVEERHTLEQLAHSRTNGTSIGVFFGGCSSEE